MGDIVKKDDKKLEIYVYIREKVKKKVIKCFEEKGKLKKIVIYDKKVG
jgi:hypothetical protein